MLRRLLLPIALAMLAFPAQAQLPPSGGITINTTPVTGGTTTQCLFITSGRKVGSQACGGAPSGAAGGVLSGTYPNPGFASIATNTVLANATSGSAAPAANAVPSCSAATSALTWTTNTGFGCNTISPGIGTVTSVSVTTANGVSGVVATSTTTPAITLTLGAITPSSVASSGAITVTSASASALAVGLTGATNPAFSVDASTGSQAAGLNVLGGTTSGAVALRILSSGTNNALTINGKGSGTITLGNVSTGNIIISNSLVANGGISVGSGNLAITAGTATVTSSSASALTVGANGATNPALRVDASAGSQAAGLLIQGAAAAGTVGVSVISSGADANLRLDAVGAGTITLGTNSTGNITLSRATTISAGSLTVSAGSITIIAAGTYTWSGLSRIASDTNGTIVLSNNGQSDFTSLKFGGTTSSFPAIKRSTTVLQARLADDSNFTQIQGLLTTAASAVTGLTPGVLAASTNASIVIYDASGTAYRVPVITP